MRSLGARVLVSAAVVLTAFLGLTALALDRAFRDSAVSAARERLQAQIYMLQGTAELAASGQVLLPDRLPDPRLDSAASGLYAQLVEPSGQIAWRSRSLVGTALEVPPLPPPGQEYFGASRTVAGVPVLSLALTVARERAPAPPRVFTLQMAEDQSALSTQVQRFRRSLTAWFVGAALVLLLAQTLILRWGLAPLRRVAREVGEVERGEKQRLEGRYPSELQALTRNLNALVAAADARLERYRNALGDLAHSMKTPLAVLRSTAESEAGDEALRPVLLEQVARLSQSVDYQLQRAAAAGRSTLGVQVAVAPLLQRVAASLRKVYASKGLSLEVEVDPGLQFRGDEGDLFEIVGNLADNACKWAGSRVRLRAEATAGRVGGSAGLRLCIEDDGPGLAPRHLDRVLRRGERADPRTEGHGIGLAVVGELVSRVYEGALSVSRSELGGACFEVRL